MADALSKIRSIVTGSDEQRKRIAKVTSTTLEGGDLGLEDFNDLPQSEQNLVTQQYNNTRYNEVPPGSTSDITFLLANAPNMDVLHKERTGEKARCLVWKFGLPPRSSRKPVDEIRKELSELSPEGEEVVLCTPDQLQVYAIVNGAVRALDCLAEEKDPEKVKTYATAFNVLMNILPDVWFGDNRHIFVQCMRFNDDPEKRLFLSSVTDIPHDLITTNGRMN